MGLVILCTARMSGDEGTALPLGSDPDARIFGVLVIYGYFYILLVQLVGVATGDKAPVQVRIKLSYGTLPYFRKKQKL